MPVFRVAFLRAALGAATILAASPAISRDAFPGAEGHGRRAAGGFGGRVVPVVNLEDDGPGSLRACAEAGGPRTCVFRVSGTIVLTRSIFVDGPEAGHLSILGQTAPGGGITLTVRPEPEAFMLTPLVLRGTSDVVIRFLRLRSLLPQETPNIDALTVENSRRVYVDHVSGSWASDENFNAEGNASELTVAYSIFGEGLRKHSKCALMGSGASEPQAISFWRNLCISNNDRNPDDNHVGGSCIEIAENVFYNARSEWAEIFTQKPGGTAISYVGNSFKAGPSTLAETNAINWNDAGSIAAPSIHAQNNAVWAPPGKTVRPVAADTEPFLVSSPACPPAVSSLGSPERAYEEVRRAAGALPRDHVDARFIREVGPWGAAGAGKLRSEPGRIEPAPTAPPYADADGDGIADELEPAFGARPGVYDPWSLEDENGWTSFDRFMAWLADERLAGRYP